jgi:hypothetical protein
LGNLQSLGPSTRGIECEDVRVTKLSRRAAGSEEERPVKQHSKFATRLIVGLGAWLGILSVAE